MVMVVEAMGARKIKLISGYQCNRCDREGHRWQCGRRQLGFGVVALGQRAAGLEHREGRGRRTRGEDEEEEAHIEREREEG